MIQVSLQSGMTLRVITRELIWTGHIIQDPIIRSRQVLNIRPRIFRYWILMSPGAVHPALVLIMTAIVPERILVHSLFRIVSSSKV